MGAGGWVTLVNWGNPEQETTGAVLENSVSLTSITPTQRPLPANWLQHGTALRITAWGIYSTTLTPTLKLAVVYGEGTEICSTAATTTGSGVANLIWRLNWEGRVKAVGSTNTSLQIVSSGVAIGIAATASTPVLMPVSSVSGNEVASLDPTTNKLITVAAQWGTASASNKITCYQYLLEALN